MSTQEVINKHRLLVIQQELTEQYRRQWSDQSRDRLFRSLQHIATYLKGFTVGTNLLTTNHESIIFGATRVPSGIVTATKSSIEHYIKYNGYLLFGQSYTGQIVVVIVYPYIENVTSQKESKVLGFYKPDAFDEATINGLLGAFLDEMTRWEGDEPQIDKFELIGFKR